MRRTRLVRAPSQPAATRAPPNGKTEKAVSNGQTADFVLRLDTMCKPSSGGRRGVKWVGGHRGTGAGGVQRGETGRV